MTESKKADEGFDITDRWTIAALEACGHVAVNIHAESEEMRKGGTRPTLIYSFAASAKNDYELWMRNEIREPFITVRKVQQSALQFKNNLYRHCR
jgi:hypothetical protein